MPTERFQKVVFVRHGVAKHNLPDPSTGKLHNLRDPALTDPSLVYQGKQQALHAGVRLQEWWQATKQGNDVELVVTSPLTRCIQTSTLLFFPGDRYTSSGSTEPTFFCTELCREATGMHYSDKRSQRSLIMKHWPTLIMDERMSEIDEAWREDTRETLSELRLRISQFLALLARRSETNIVVVTHGVWLEECFRSCCPRLLDNGRRRVFNCDMFAFDCVSKDMEFVRFENPHQI
eukprot:CAMPEP_0197273638 /NCGR_PEP_ID=MMETSP1432-20130617/11546_1 /TAXON_ID=44447 /ORGANISM="Pseudo-nitzschia delicatissima, Strain UNC1205" /LENGTH=233 /DNA_ID=CAMNT_0042739325 /DNA_START=90 /DNA_END=791 /DNA_ORIENTATION=+